MNRLVRAVAYDRLCTFEFGVVVEVFGLPRPELDVEWYEFGVVGADPGPLRALGNLTVTVDGGLDELATAGTVVLPGWRDVHETPPEPLLDALRAAHANGARMVSVCSGAFVLAAAGLLDGRRAATHWRYADELAGRHPRVRVDRDVLYVDEGDVLTSAGSAAGIDLCLHLVRRDHGAEVANAVARRLVVPPHRDGGQSQFLPEPVAAEGRPDVIGEVLDWALAHLDRPLTVADLARRGHFSVRTFARRFADATGTTPSRWLAHQRVVAAQRLLERGDDPLEKVARATGLGTAANLRHHFRRSLSVTPSAYRTAFRGQATASSTRSGMSKLA